MTKQARSLLGSVFAGIFPAAEPTMQPRDRHAPLVADGLHGLEFCADVIRVDKLLLGRGVLGLAPTGSGTTGTPWRALSDLAGLFYDLKCRGLAYVKQAVALKFEQGSALLCNFCKKVMAVFTQHAKEGHDKHVVAGAEGAHHVADFIPVKLPDMPFIDTRSQQRGGLIGNARHSLDGPCDTHKVPACQQLKHSVSNIGCEILNGKLNHSRRAFQ